MKKYAYFTAALLMLTAMGGCKPSEKHYREAYETAKAKTEQAKTDDMGHQLMTSGMPRETEVSNGIVLPLLTEPLIFTDKNVTSKSDVRRYNVVVSKFKQVFNAKAMYQRLRESGYDRAALLLGRDGYYYVAASSIDDPAMALSELDRVGNDKSLPLKSPFPYVIRPAHLAR